MLHCRDTWFRTLSNNWSAVQAVSSTYLFQCSLLWYRAGKTRGTSVVAFSLIRLIIQSLFQKYKALSATCDQQHSVKQFHHHDLLSHLHTIQRQSDKMWNLPTFLGVYSYLSHNNKNHHFMAINPALASSLVKNWRILLVQSFTDGYQRIWIREKDTGFSSTVSAWCLYFLKPSKVI